MPNDIDGFAEAQDLLTAYDAGHLEGFDLQRTARDLADWWLENRYAVPEAEELDHGGEEDAAYYAVLAGLEVILEEE